MRLPLPAWLAAALVLLLGATLPVGAQGNFQNLGFESATIVQAPGYPAGLCLFDQAFPGWTGSVGGIPVGLARYNGVAMSTAGFSILDRDYYDLFGWGGVIAGNFTIQFMSGAVGAGEGVDTTLSQTGLVPTGTQSLRFRANVQSPLGPWGVTLGGETLSLVPLASGTNYTLFGADIHTWAGQTPELAFTAYYPHPHVGQVHVFLDSIQFSNQPIPEPGAIVLSALGALPLGGRSLRRLR